MTDPDIQEKIKNAINEAFRKPTDLQEMLQYKLNEHLSNIVNNDGSSVPIMPNN